MGWDFSMEVDTGGSDPVTIVDDLNYTYNVSPMLYDALPFADGVKGINGMLGHQALSGLREGLAAMQDHPDKYRAMAPKNGWGDYNGALMVLKTLIYWAEAHPKATFRVD